MVSARVTVSLDRKTLTRLDRLVQARVFPNRGKAIQAALDEKLRRLDRKRLERECAKLDSRAEQAIAEEGFTKELD